MKQVFMQKNNLRPAAIQVEEVPVPRCGRSHVLLANAYSLISAGTETAAVRRTKRDMVVKAISDPDLRQSVTDMLVRDGVRKTAARVIDEMTKWTPLGYSGAGVAIEVGPEVAGIRPGDLVAYGGEGHAEYIRAAKHLCVRVPDGVSAAEAAFVALGSIALQAVRRAEIQVGDVVAVLGLGLVGQLTSQMLQAAGARVLGSDLIDQRLERAAALGMERGFAAGDQLPSEVLRFTAGSGVDRVLICASTASSQVIDQAIAMARDRARIVVVGMVGLDVPCEAFYRKELDLVTSRSYGPGRYDPQYEEHGIDYPRGYVRWTEQRNMQEFLRLVQARKVDVKSLTTSEFDVDDAARGYDLLVNQPAECLAVLLRYQGVAAAPLRCVAVTSRQATASSRGNVAVIGCGSFARQFHLPNLQGSHELHFEMLVASSGQNAKEMAVRYGAARCATDPGEVWNDPAVDAVMVLTRDTSHAAMTIAALKAGKHVFCEKPLATSYEQCRELCAAAAGSDRIAMIGFNRRFAPLVVKVKEELGLRGGPIMMHYRVNAGPLPKNHWTFDPIHSSGRIVGEACHFVDLFCWLINSEPIRVSAHVAGELSSALDLENVTATFEFEDGSIATLLYTTQGSPAFPKERLELFRGGMALSLDDFSRLTVRGPRRLDFRHRRVDKGHAVEFSNFAAAVLGKAPPGTSYRDGIRATICCLKLLESARTYSPVLIDPANWCCDAVLMPAVCNS